MRHRFERGGPNNKGAFDSDIWSLMVEEERQAGEKRTNFPKHVFAVEKAFTSLVKNIIDDMFLQGEEKSEISVDVYFLSAERHLLNC